MSAWGPAYLAEDAAESACRAASVVLVGRLRRQALARAADHAAARTRIQTLLTDVPVVPPAYAQQPPITTSDQARTLIEQTENSLVPVYADAAAATTGASRSWAVDQAVACAVAAIRWGGRTMAFPQGSADDEVPTQTQDQ